MTQNSPKPCDYFSRAKALCQAIVAAREDLKQLRADAVEEMGLALISKDEAAATRKDLSEVFAVAMLEARSELPKSAEKIERRIRIAAECGVQLTFMDQLAQTAKIAGLQAPAVMQ
ncbi:hypothetical protein [Ferrovibrio sp.]|uniref:hypothetical protein n=1 Tax=Ferrovibrio sp. TaxID=1917215 RepID=UPI0035B03A06